MSFWRQKFPIAARNDLPLWRLTTLRVGGPGIVLMPRTVEELGAIVDEARIQGESYSVLGRGANLLVGDSGVAGLVICTRELKDFSLSRGRIVADAGVSLTRMVARAGREGLMGLEPLIGIPATVGGAVAMNAGGRYGTIFDHLVRATVLTPDGHFEERSRIDLEPRYRAANLAEGEIVVQAVFELMPDDPFCVLGRTQDVLREKSLAQPLHAVSAGCIFKNPAGCDASAGRLIDRAGLKGARVGDAEISTQHANFIVNRGRASARDVFQLIALVKEQVMATFGVELELEIKTWSPFDQPVLQPL